MSGIKKLTPGEIKLIVSIYRNGETNLRTLTAEINSRRVKNGKEQIKSINTVKNYLVGAGLYNYKRYVLGRDTNLNKILVDHNEKTELMKICNTSFPTVRKALNGKSDSELSIIIRKTAIERGGIEYKPLNNNVK